MTDPAANPRPAGPGPIVWAILFLLSFAALAALRATGAIAGPIVLLLCLIPMALLVPLVRSAERRHASRGCGSPAILRYNRGMLIASFAYVLGLGTAILIHNNIHPGPALAWPTAFLPILPIFAMIWVMGRYLKEETDEYLRHRAIMASLVGLALVLGLGSFWGFLETFELVPHVPGWWAVPIWAVGLGIGQLWMTARDR
jgi:hypothetical protein